MKRMACGWAMSVVLAALLGADAQAGTFDVGIPEGWACEGSCGTGVADGVVTLAPAGGEQYGWVATTGSPLRSLGLPGIGGTHGSRLRSTPFAAEAGELLEFQFNYVTSDGAGFADYAWARLLDTSLEPVALLFTARTRSSGNIVPGFGMPEIAAEIEPETVNIIGGGPRWTPLGGDSGRCYSSGCGYTDWVDSRYPIPAAGEYVLEFGVVNWSDTLFQSGLAFDGVVVGGKPIGAQPDYRDVRVTARLAEGGVRLEMDGFAAEPSRIDEVDGRQEVEWNFEGFSLGQIRDLDFELTVEDPRPGETRQVVEEIVIRYLDLLGQEHLSTLGPLDVDVRSSAFALDIATDREIYFPGDTATVTLQVSNHGVLTNTPVIGWEIRDEEGHRVAGFSAIGAHAFAPGESRVFVEEGFEIAGLYTGGYVAVASLADPMTDALIETHADFNVAVPVDAGLDARILVDRPAYDVHESVELLARLENTAPNLQIVGHEVRLLVLDPHGTEIWRRLFHPGSLPPGGYQELVERMPLGGAPAGDYRVLLVVIDDGGSVTALAETGFRVRSTADTGAGLSGTLAIAPNTVLRSEDLTLHATVTNDGNTGVSNLPVNLLLLDPGAELELGQWTETVDLELDTTASLSAAWNVDVPAGTLLVAVLRAEFQGEYRILATASVRVQERFVSDPLLDGRGRLLVLLDPPGRDECVAVQGMTLRLPGIGSLEPGDQLQVDLHDDLGRLLDSEVIYGSETFPVDRVMGAGTNLVLDSLDAGALELGLNMNAGPEGDTGHYYLLATLHREGSVSHLESDPFATTCGELPATGTRLGDFRLVAVSMEAEGPSVRHRAFLESLLDAQGWSYRIVTDGPAFAEEFRQGGYASFLLLANRVKLENQVARELREAVFAGRGIVKAGAEDHRNHHLLEVFGADLLGLQPHAMGLLPYPSAPFTVPEPPFTLPVQAVEIRLHEGFAIAEYHGDRRQRTHIAAASAHRFGKGRTLLAGFDLLAQAEAEGVSGAFAGFLVDALEYTVPEPAILRPGMSVPMRWWLANRGGPASILLTLEMSGGRITDPGQGVLLGPRELVFALDMPAESLEGRSFWWLLPWDYEMPRVTASLELSEGFQTVHYGVTFHDLTIEGLADFADLEQQVAARQGLHAHYALVLEEVQLGGSLHQQGDAGGAVAHLLKAADWLALIHEPEAKDIRVSLAWLIHRLGPEIPAD